MQSGGVTAAHRVPRAISELVGWLLVAPVGCLMLTQTIGWDGTRLVATAQSLTPYAILLLVPVAWLAAWFNAHLLGFVTSLVGIAGLLLASPLVFAPNQPAVADDAVGMTVASMNLYYDNPTVADAATTMLARGVDVIVFVEYTAEHQRTLLSHPLADQFPYKLDRDGHQAGGIAIWSRFPLEESARQPTVNYSLDAVVAGPDGSVRIFAVHPPTPVYNYAGWKRDLALIGDIGRQTPDPRLVIGDFNASYWHPPFRDLLKRGFVDAHMAADRGFATSWPTDRWFPPFVQLDHALTGSGLVSTAVENFDVPGSDHRSIVVTVAPAR